jgi:hypothetical protein
MNNNELDNLVESFLSPKQNSKAMDLNELFALFDELKLTEVQLQPVYPSGKEKGYEREESSIELFYQIYNDVLATKVSSGADPIDKITNFVNFVNELKKEEPSEQPTNLSYALATILFTTSLHKMIEDFLPDTPSSAGFFFEKFINLLFKTGTVSTENSINPFPIQDLEVEMEGKPYYLSLKLVKSKNITGSIGNMLKFFENKYTQLYSAGNHKFSLVNFDEQGSPTISNSPLDKKIIYIVANKAVETRNEVSKNVIIFNMFEFNFEQFLNMLGKDRAEKYNNYLKNPAFIKNKLKQLKDKIEEIETEINREETAESFFDTGSDGSDIQDYEKSYNDAAISSTRAKIEDLYKKRDALNAEYVKVSEEDVGSGSTASSLQFSFNIETLKANSKSKEGLTLSMRPNDRDTILNKNKKIFDEKIELILKEAGLINYKVNNYFLSLNNEEMDEQQIAKLGNEAYSSAKQLETNLGSKIGLKT